MNNNVYVLVEELKESLIDERNYLINELGNCLDSEEILQLSGKIYMINKFIQKLYDIV